MRLVVSGYYFLVSLGYALLTIAVGVYEQKRIRVSGPDVISIFIVLFVVQCCLPGIVIYACLPLVPPGSPPTDVAAFDRIFAAADLSAAFLVLLLTAWFILFFYGFTQLNRRLLESLWAAPRGSRLVLAGSQTRLVIVLAFGLVLSLASFYVLGSSLVERYTNLILFRAGTEDVQGNLLNAFGFALTQSWSWLSVPALFVIYERRGRGLLWFLCLVGLGVFVLLGVSRRALFIPPLLAYLTLVVFDRRWRLSWLLTATVPVLLWIAFGKELIGIIGFGGTLSDVFERYETLPASFLRASSDIGITIVESLGSINLLDLPPRFGIDHLLSVLRQIPTSHSWLGILPVRMVRLSTEAFASPFDEDIPPGLLGQMWIDFRVFGPIVWALILSMQMSIVQHIFGQTIRTRQAVALFALVTFVVALPLNTGTYDFTFSTEVYALALSLFLTFRLIRVRVPAADLSVASATAHP